MMNGRSSNSGNPNDNYKYTGHERDEEAGLTLDYMNARNYDPIIGRFLQIDPLFDHPAYWGAVIGFAVEVSTQMAVDMVANDASLSDALSNVDWKDVGTSTLADAASSGLSTIKNASTVIKAGGDNRIRCFGRCNKS